MPTQHQRLSSPVSLTRCAAAFRRLLSRRTLRRGPYQLTQKLGDGGCTEVYLARHRRQTTADQVVVKTLAPSANLTMHRRQLQREARLWSQVHEHPNTVRILDASRCSGRWPYFVMQYSAGVTLWEKTILQRHPLDLHSRLNILTQVCDFLQHVHGHGVIHADLAPKNILLIASGGTAHHGVRVLDFGLAQELDTIAGEAESPDAIRGTPAFMSPEACRSSDLLTPHSDIYSFGCLGYFLLSGEIPFSGATPIEICWKQIHAAPPRLADVTEAPSELDDLLAACMAKSIADRPPSMDAIALQLHSISCKIAPRSLPREKPAAD